jgi:hypothetical protein
MDNSLKKFFQAAHRDLKKHDVPGFVRPEEEGGQPTTFSRRRFVGGLAPMAAAMAVGGVTVGAVESLAKGTPEPSTQSVTLGAGVGYAVQMIREMHPNRPISQRELKMIMRELREQYILFSRFELKELQQQLFADEKSLVAHVEELSVALKGRTGDWACYVPEDKPDQQPQHALTWLRDGLFNALSTMTYLENESTTLVRAEALTRTLAERLKSAPAKIAAVREAAAALNDENIAYKIDAIAENLASLQRHLARYNDRARCMNDRGFARGAD